MQAPQWLTAQMAGALHALQAAAPAAAGLVDAIASAPEQWEACQASAAAQAPAGWGERFTAFQQLLLHKVRRDACLPLLRTADHAFAAGECWPAGCHLTCMPGRVLCARLLDQQASLPAACTARHAEALPCADAPCLRASVHVQALHVEHLPAACQAWVADVLGPAAAAPKPVALQDLLQAGSPSRQAVIVKAPGSSPLAALQQLAAEQGASLRTISLGESATLMAEPILSHAVGAGDWLCLQNCHLAAAWMPRQAPLAGCAAALTGAAAAWAHPCCTPPSMGLALLHTREHGLGARC